MQLDKLDKHLHDQGAQIADVLEPGLSEHDIDDAVMDAVGLRLPVEARTWFSWHNGTRPLTLADGRPGAAYLPTGFTVMSLAQAIDDCQSSRMIARDQESEGLYPAAEWWAPSWFPIAVGAHPALVTVDCAVPAGEPTPIRVVEWDYGEGWDAICAESLTQAVGWWVGLLDRGIYRWDSVGRDWEDNWDRIPALLRQTRLV